MRWRRRKASECSNEEAVGSDLYKSRWSQLGVANSKSRTTSTRLLEERLQSKLAQGPTLFCQAEEEPDQ
jgi:hypothetical protein